MPVLFWYFPLIIFFGACDLVFSTRKPQRAAETPSSPPPEDEAEVYAAAHLFRARLARATS